MEITRTKERFSNELAIVFVDGRTQIHVRPEFCIWQPALIAEQGTDEVVPETDLALKIPRQVADIFAGKVLVAFIPEQESCVDWFSDMLVTIVTEVGQGIDCRSWIGVREFA
jgi:hypothetical protein